MTVSPCFSLFLPQSCCIKTLLCKLSLGSCWHSTDYCAPVVFSSNPCWLKVLSSIFFFFFFVVVVQMIQGTDKGTNEAFRPPSSSSSSSSLRLLVNLGCIQSSPLRGKTKQNKKSPTSHFSRDWRLVSDIHKSQCLDCDSGWVHSSRPWVLHSRRRWQEWVWRGRGQILGTFLLIGWLLKSPWLSRGWVRLKGQRSTFTSEIIN